MEKIIINNNKIISILLEEDEEEDENPLVTIKRNPIDKFFTTRIDEGFLEILINGHLNSSKPKFRVLMFMVRTVINYATLLYCLNYNFVLIWQKF